MRDDQTQAIRKWAAILVPALALALACLTGPVAYALKVTVKDLVRQELSAYQKVAASEAKWKVFEDYQNEVAKRWEHDMAALRDKPVLSDTNYAKLFAEMGTRLSSLEAKIMLLMGDPPRDKKNPDINPDP
jgi:hypothetical protein